MLFFLCQFIGAQQPAVIHLSEKDGLPDIEFYDIIEDSKSYIWLAANKGLYRYNGRSFTHFVHPDQRGNSVFGVQEDDKGRIWYTNISGQFFYLEDNESTLFIDLGNELKGQLAEFIIANNELIVLPGQFIIRVDLTTQKVKTKASQNSLIGSVEKTTDGYLFTRKDYIIKTDSSFVSTDSLKLEALYDHGLLSQISKRVYISSGANANLCHFFKLGANEFYLFNFKDLKYAPIKIPSLLKPRTINHTFFYENEIWLSTDQGLFICELSQGELTLKRHLFPKMFITKIAKDKESNYWITTKGDGILVIPNINIFQHNFSKSKLNIGKLERVNNRFLVFGTNDGKVGLFDLRKFKYRLIDTTSAYRVSEISNFIGSDQTFIIKEDKVLSLDNTSLHLNPIDAPKMVGAKSFSKMNDSTFVLSSYKQATAMDQNLQERSILIGKRSYINYHSSKNKRTFIGTVEGLFSFDEATERKEIRYLNRPILAKNIVETNDGDLWVATFNGGLFVIRKDSVFTNYHKDRGLLSNSISTIKNDDNSIWIATDEGIQYFNTTTGEFKNLTKQNGIPSYRISDIEVDDQTVFFATNDGIFSVDKTKAFKDLRISKVYISDVSIGLESVELKKEYRLNYDDNSIKISFNSNGFQSFIHNKYEFRLLGQSDVWQVDENKSNAVSYYSLPSGNYTFQVKSVLADENDEYAIDSIQFSIAKPFWKAWWFYTVLFIFLTLSIYGLIQRKINTLKREQSEELQKELINKQLVLSQLENLRSQMNPHFIFNALNSIQEYIVFNEKELARSYLVKFSRLIRIYLEHSRENEVLLSEEINALNIYLELEKNRFEDLLHYEIKVSDDLNTQQIKIPSLFIQPYVENAIKHGLLHKKEDRQLIVEFGLLNDGDTLCCIIRDNGIGIEASKKINQQKASKHKSFALSANQKRVDLLNVNRSHKITVETSDLSKKGTSGTEVMITIPLKTQES